MWFERFQILICEPQSIWHKLGDFTSGISMVSLLWKKICKIETIEQYDYEGCFARFFEQKQRCPIEWEIEKKCPPNRTSLSGAKRNCKSLWWWKSGSFCGAWIRLLCACLAMYPSGHNAATTGSNSWLSHIWFFFKGIKVLGQKNRRIRLLCACLAMYPSGHNASTTGSNSLWCHILILYTNAISRKISELSK